MKKIAMALFTLAFVLCLAGCQKTTAPAEGNRQAETERGIDLTAYLTAVRAQSDTVKTFLEQEALTQTDMNEKSGELADLWNETLDTLLAEAKKILPTAEYDQLMAGQAAWEAEKKAAIEAAGKDYQGGSMYALVINSEEARITEARVLMLAEQLTHQP